jgi:2'-5' RNA ligase
LRSEQLYEIANRIKTKYPDTFRPMTTENLHCTVVFYGSLLTKGPPEISRQVQDSMRAACSNRSQQVILRPELKSFPPAKQNLVVALLQVPQDWFARRSALIISEVDQSNKAH